MKTSREPAGGWGEFLLVVVGAFGCPVLGSLYYAFNPQVMTGYTTGSFWGLVVFEISFLIVLGSVLRYRGWSLRSLGLTFHWTDIPAGIVLALVAWLSYRVLFSGLSLVVPNLSVIAANLHVVTPGVSFGSVLSVVIVNPVYEEIFVAGYIIASLKDGRHTGLAINTSVAVRLLYHLYQGMIGVVLIVPFGLLFATWFARTRRLWPLIVAHALFDAAGMFPFVRW